MGLVHQQGQQAQSIQQLVVSKVVYMVHETHLILDVFFLIVQLDYLNRLGPSHSH
jgi:hypothetical protein